MTTDEPPDRRIEREDDGEMRHCCEDHRVFAELEPPASGARRPVLPRVLSASGPERDDRTGLGARRSPP